MICLDKYNGYSIYIHGMVFYLSRVLELETVRSNMFVFCLQPFKEKIQNEKETGSDDVTGSQINNIKTICN